MGTKEIVALVPAFGGTRDFFGIETKRSPLLRMLNGLPLASHLFSQFQRIGIKTVFICISPDHEKNLESMLVALGKKNDLKVVIERPKVSQNVVDSLSLLGKLVPKNVSILTNFGDTFCEYNFDSLVSKKRAAVLASIPDGEEWETVLVNKNDFVITSQPSASEALQVKVPCGIYFWNDAEEFFSSIGLLDSASSLPFATRIFANQNFLAEPSQRWIDADHDYAFFDGKSKMQESRKFNSIQIDSTLGIVKKSSETNNEKIARELRFYENIPQAIRVLFPRLINSNSNSEASYQIEFYSYPTLAEIFLYRNLTPKKWRVVFRKLNTLIWQYFHSYKNRGEAPWEEYFISKTLGRLEDLATLIEPGIFLTDRLCINGKNLFGVKHLLDRAHKVLSKVDHNFVFTHGDLVFSNILCSPEDLTFRFIDPRGGLGRDTVFGPHLYDIAKLCNSIIGKYEVIANDLFCLSFREDEIEFNLLLEKTFDDLDIEVAFLEEFNLDRGLATLLASLVLLSIPLMHEGEGLRPQALLTQGIILGNEALDLLGLSEDRLM